MTANPWPAGSDEAVEHDAIAARLADPALERRYARALAVPAPARLELEVHAEQLERIAASGVLFGPDCSQFQGVVDWARVRAAGCMIGGYKVSEGRTFQDPQHQNNRRNVPAAGLVPLAYHYLYGSAEYAGHPDLWAAQAAWFCSLVDPSAIHALDVEAAMSAPGLDVSTWVAEYRRHFPTKPLLIYSNKGMWLNRSHVTDPWPAGVQVWHAGYRDGAYTSATGSLTGEWAATGSLSNSLASLGAPPAQLWQFTDHAAVPGVSGLCDGNAFQGSLRELQALATGTTGDDHMSQQDVDNLKAYLVSDTFKDVIKNAVHNTPIGQLTNANKTPVTLGQIEAATWGVLGNVDELSPAAVQAVTGAISGQLASLPDAIAAKLGGNADGAVVKQAVADALRESLPTFNIVAQSPHQA